MHDDEADRDALNNRDDNGGDEAGVDERDGDVTMPLSDVAQEIIGTLTGAPKVSPEDEDQV